MKASQTSAVNVKFWSQCFTLKEQRASFCLAGKVQQSHEDKSIEGEADLCETSAHPHKQPFCTHSRVFQQSKKKLKNSITTYRFERVRLSPPEPL